jgi:Bacterial antitoxin of type II TA system, VapB
MKTTLELDDSLLREAKGVAAQRGTTLKAIIEHALRREVAPAPEVSNPAPEQFEVGPLGFLVLKRKPGDSIAIEQIKAIQAELDDAEFLRAINPPQK